MWIRWIGAVLVLLGGGGFGFSVAQQQRREERLLEQLYRALEFMENELSCNLTPLPTLCALAAAQAGGEICAIFSKLSDALLCNSAADARSCMDAALREVPPPAQSLRDALSYLGQSLGRFDLRGQLSGFSATKQLCARRLAALREDQQTRLRSYRILGLCGGAALAILLI